MNNFNCKDSEYLQLKSLQNTKYSYFVNANIKTKHLYNVLNYDNKIVVTVNPDIIPPSISMLTKAKIIKSKIAFVRIKYVPNCQEIDNLILRFIKWNIPIVVTVQRFKKLDTLNKFTKKDCYDYKNGFFRLNKLYLLQLQQKVNHLKQGGAQIYICDEKGTGCADCQLCSILTTGKELPIYSLNLSSSGVCQFNCPDCFAKIGQQRTCGKIWYNTINKNKKQKEKKNYVHTDSN